ncbi:hypothetical protein D3C81_1773730 [compost metagenome]
MEVIDHQIQRSAHPCQRIDHDRSQGEQSVQRLTLDQQQQVILKRDAGVLQRADEVGAKRFQRTVFLRQRQPYNAVAVFDQALAPLRHQRGLAETRAAIDQDQPAIPSRL